MPTLAAAGVAESLVITEQQLSKPTVPNYPKFDRSVSLLSWGYNEEKLVADYLTRVRALLDEHIIDWEIVFVNDGSTDSTGEILDAFAAADPRIRPIHNEQNMNVGKSCRRAIMAASKDYLFWQTVDWSYDIRNLRIFLELLNHYDVVQGVRPTPIRLLSYIPVVKSLYRVKTRSDNFKKAIVSLSNYYILRILFGVGFHDFQNVTFYPTKLLQSTGLSGNSSFLNPECLIRTYAKGATYIEVPIPFIARTIGEAKGTKITSILKSIRDILTHWLAWGWKFRLARYTERSNARIHRVAEPFQLDSEVAKIVVPLFADFR